MRALILTNEYPPEIYGGAGVHVDELTRHLRPLVELDIRTFGTREELSVGWRVQGYPPAHDLDQADEQLRPMLAALSRGLSMVADPVRADVVHAHTWYTHFAGLLVRRAHGIPLVLTVHSLEPLRPWKREQLAGGLRREQLDRAHSARVGRRGRRRQPRDARRRAATLRRAPGTGPCHP